jgi:sugar diacid utilization regulator
MCIAPPPQERPENAEQMLQAATRARLSRQLVDDLLDGATDTVPQDPLAGSALTLGHDPHRSYRVLALWWKGRALDDRFIDAVAAAAGTVQVACWTTRRDQALIVLAQRSDTDAWASTGVWQAMHSEIALTSDGVGSMGVGGLAPAPPDIPRSYRQAQQALYIQRASTNPHGVTNHDRLGIYGLVTEPEAGDFVQEWLASLLDYDEEHSTELTGTLAAYLNHRGHYGETADDLDIHRSTVRYRLQLIRDLTHHDLGDPEIRFNLQIATRIHDGTTAASPLN